MVDLTASVKAKDGKFKAKDDQIKDMKREVHDARDKLKALYEAMQEEVKDYEALSVMRTRAQLMWLYLIGEASI